MGRPNMTNPWEAEVPLGQDQAAELIQTQFPELSPVSLEWLGAGWDNTAWLVNQTYVFRFPRRQLGAETLQSEVTVLPHIAHRLPVPTSAPTMVGQPAGDYPWLFAGYPLLRGTCLCDAALTENDRIRLAEPLAEFLRTLHSISSTEALELGAPPDLLSRLDVHKREAKTRELLEMVVARQYVPGKATYEQILDEALSIDSVGMQSLVHGDLYSLHLLVNDDKQLAGVIDWGDVHAGHISADLPLIYVLLPPAGREIFFSIYGEIDSQTRTLARFRALHHTLLVANYAAEIDRSALLQEAIQGLHFLATS